MVQVNWANSELANRQKIKAKNFIGGPRAKVRRGRQSGRGISWSSLEQRGDLDAERVVQESLAMKEVDFQSLSVPLRARLCWGFGFAAL
jgi:hypothetical protein